jgi:hypothetical protein
MSPTIKGNNMDRAEFLAALKEIAPQYQWITTYPNENAGWLRGIKGDCTFCPIEAVRNSKCGESVEFETDAKKMGIDRILCNFIADAADNVDDPEKRQLRKELLEAVGLSE